MQLSQQAGVRELGEAAVDLAEPGAVVVLDEQDRAESEGSPQPTARLTLSR